MSARVLAPLLVLVFGLITIWLSYHWNLADDLERGQSELQKAADATGARLARLGGQLHSPVGLATLRADLEASVEAPNLALAAFVDARGGVLAGSSGELSGREARETLLRAAANLMRAEPGARTLHSEDGRQLYAAYPVVESDSWVLLVFDRSATIRQARLAARRSLQWSAGSMAVLCLMLWAVLHFGFAKRIGRLAGVVREFGSGCREPIEPLAGSDEVAELSQAFAGMADRVAAHERQRVKMEKEILEATERERMRIGHELHDGLGQRLTAAALAADSLADLLAGEGRAGRERAAGIADRVRAAITETRRLSHGLAPVGIERGGLVAALAEMAEAIRAGDKLRAIFERPAEAPACPGDTATHLFRIAQEAVSNALRHASPGEIRIGLTGDSGSLVLEVEDDGRGMPEQPPDSGIGLRLMRYRAQLLGGTLDIEPSPAGGTIVRCRIPLCP